MSLFTLLGHSKALPVQTMLLRNASSYYKEKTNKPTEAAEEATKYNRRYVEVDTPFAKANKYTYAMPDDPYVASEKVGKILQIGTVDDAADYIKALPIYLQSPVVWNQLIGHCAKHGRANYAEQYYAQVKKKFFILFFLVIALI
jgi:pentatricopeptide repeat protein